MKDNINEKYNLETKNDEYKTIQSTFRSFVNVVLEILGDDEVSEEQLHSSTYVLYTILNTEKSNDEKK